MPVRIGESSNGRIIDDLSMEGLSRKEHMLKGCDYFRFPDLKLVGSVTDFDDHG